MPAVERLLFAVFAVALVIVALVLFGADQSLDQHRPAMTGTLSIP